MRAMRLNHTVHLWAFKSNNVLKEATNDFFHFRLFTFLPAREETAGFSSPASSHDSQSPSAASTCEGLPLCWFLGWLDPQEQDLYTVSHPHLSDTGRSMWWPSWAPVESKDRMQEDSSVFVENTKCVIDDLCTCTVYSSGHTLVCFVTRLMMCQRTEVFARRREWKELMWLAVTDTDVSWEQKASQWIGWMQVGAAVHGVIFHIRL